MSARTLTRPKATSKATNARLTRDLQVAEAELEAQWEREDEVGELPRVDAARLPAGVRPDQAAQAWHGAKLLTKYLRLGMGLRRNSG